MLLKSHQPRCFDVLAFGDPVADIVVSTQDMPALGSKVVGRALGVWGGGTTANVACAVGRLGLSAALYGRVGNDAHTNLLENSLTQFGVSLDYLERNADCASASAITMITPSGEKSIIYMPMPSQVLSQDKLSAALAQSHLVYAMPYDLAELRLLSALAREQNTLVAIDIEAAVAPDPQAMRERVALADIVFFNEAGFTAGAPTLAELRRILDLGPQMVVVTCGEAGAMAVSHQSETSHPSFPAIVIDTTGAGDSFNAAFLTSVLSGAALDSAVRFACAAASCTVAALGARTGLPDRSMVQEILQDVYSSDHQQA